MKLEELKDRLSKLDNDRDDLVKKLKMAYEKADKYRRRIQELDKKIESEYNTYKSCLRNS